MEKITKQLRWLLASLMLVVGVGSAWADEETIDFSAQGYSNQQAITSVSATNFAVSFDKGSNSNAPKYYTSGTAIRCYGGNSFTVTSGYEMTKIVITFGSSDGSNNITTDVDTYNNGTWTGSAQSVKFTIDGTSGNRRIQKIAVTYTPAANQVATPSISPNGCSFLNSQEVSITCSTSGATIQYSTDGGNTWLNYSSPFTITETTTVQAKATKSGMTASGIATAAFTKATVMSVAEARAAIVSGTSTTGAYVTGIVSEIVTAYNSQYGDISYNISADGETDSDQLLAFRGKSYNGNNFTSADDIQVGATVVVYGNLKKYNDTYEFDAGNQLVSYVAPDTPYITAEDVSITYDATASSIAYTVNNPITGGTVSAATTSDWVTLSSNYTSPIAFTCAANTSALKRTATVTLTYTYGTKTATKDVTITQAGNPNVTMTIAEVRSQETGDVITSGIVTSCVGTTGYIQDATAAICVYGAELTVGDHIKVSGKLSTYKGLLEITSPDITVNSHDNTIEPEVMTIAEINASTKQGWLVKIENANVISIDGQNTTIAQGENTIVVRGITSGSVEMNDVITLTGNIGCFDVAQIANPTNIIKSQTQKCATPIFSPTAGTYTSAKSVEITCTTEGATIYYTTDGSIPTINSTEYTSAIVVNNTTTIKAIAVKDGLSNSDVAEATYTINLNSASLPFTFDGGKADIENTPGLTQEGLGGDYSSSPKLKFDNSNDWVILNFNERPGKLTFDIKGNTFSGGTFKVQTSVDGETYTDLETYTELGSTQNESFDNLGENVRYIKWIYTEKSSGNVALGNITLAKYEEDTRIDTQTTFEQDAYEITHGDPFTAPTATLNPSDAGDLKYSSSMTSVATVDENTGAVSILTSGTTIITAKFLGNETYKPSEASYTLTVNTPETAPTFTLITSDDEFDDGDYIIVYEGVAMNTTVSSNRLQYTEVTPENNVIRTDNASIIWHIAKSGDYYTIYNADANEYAASTGSKNQATMLEDGTDDKALWSVTPGETFDFTNKYNYDKMINANLRRNGTYGFACYATGTGGPLSLYRKDGTHARIATTISFSQSGPFSVDFGDDFTTPTATLTPADAGSLVYSSSDENVATVDATTGEVSIVNTGTCLITAEFVGNENYKPSNQSYQLTVNPKLNPKNIGSEYYVKVTSIDQIENGDAVIIVYEYGNVAMNTTQNPDNRTAVTIVKNNGTIQLTNGTGGTLNNIPVTEKLILVKDGDYYHFYASRGTNNGFLYMAGYNTEDFLRTQETLNGNSKAAVSIDSNSNANIVFQGDRTGTGFHNTLYWDPISNVFSCYLPNKELMEPIQLYVEVEKGATETVELVDAQDCYKTMAAPYNMDLTGSDLKAYIVTLNDEQNEAEFVPVTKIPAGTPIVLHSETAGTYELTKAGSNFTADDVVADNELKESDGSVTGDASTIYVLNKNPEIGFYLLNSGKTLAEGKCYLQIEKGNGAKFIGFHFEGEATGIAGLESANDKLQGTIYNLAGQRVTTPAHGLYIVNGKKVFIK